MMFENAQWKVTPHGLEAKGRHSYYAIQKDHLKMNDWAAHMSSKSWVDQGLFSEAFNEAIKLHHGAG
jgi:tripartite-type tricarboxylate transporter receptor subunit TctC